MIALSKLVYHTFFMYYTIALDKQETLHVFYTFRDYNSVFCREKKT